jgi:two-component system cell cycle sensor histidine kinase/response regulator CckA
MKSDVTFQLESAVWPAFVVEAGGTIRYANQAAVDFFGPRLEGESLSLSALFAESDESAEQFVARWERSPVASIAIKFRGKGGRVATYETYICSTREIQKRYVLQLIHETESHAAPSGISGDLSELGAAADKAAGSDTAFVQKQKLDCALQLTRTVALDFNNVLTGILGHTSLLLGQAPIDHPWRSSLIEVERAAEKAAEITHHLATFSRQEKEPPSHVSGNLNSVLRRVIDSFKKNKPESIRWGTHFEHHLYSVKFDEAKVQQVFIKIVENAVESLEDSGSINISSRNLDISEATQDRTAQLVPGPYVCIEVSDNGKGIDAETLPRIFEPFFSTKHGHRGLGLAWVYGIITNHRGGVAVSSHPGQGTSVRVYLPAIKKFVAETSVIGQDTGSKETILMVDDEDLLLTMGQTILSSFGYRVLTANSGVKALELVTAEKEPIGLVITDLVMPQMSGRELIDQIQLRLPGVPILCTSGFVHPGSREESESYLAKPFTSQQLLRRVKQLLEPSGED